MSPLPSFQELVASVTMALTRPSYESPLVILTGWLFCRRRTVTGAIQGADAVGGKHQTSFHRLFSRARWDSDRIGLSIFRLILPYLGADMIFLAVDDTLAPKFGACIFGAGMHHDAIQSTRKVPVINRGHSWVTLSVLVCFPFRLGFWFALPVLTALYRNKKSCATEGGDYFTKPELAVQLIRLLCERYAERRFHLLGDSGYSGESVVKLLPATCTFTGRMHPAAALYAPPPAHTPGKRGRPRVKGERLPSPRKMLETATTELDLNVFGCTEHQRIASCTALWYKAAGSRLLRVVAAQPANDKPRAYFSTDATASARDVLVWYARRHALEQTFHDAKGQLGFTDPQSWTENAVRRTAPMILYLYSLIVLWFARHGMPCLWVPDRPWYRQKDAVCFTDMLVTLRVETLKHDFQCQRAQGTLAQNYLERLLYRIAQAA